MNPEADEIQLEDLEAAAEMYDKLMAGTLYNCTNISHEIGCQCMKTLETY